jgi:hypothetical protein
MGLHNNRTRERRRASTSSLVRHDAAQQLARQIEFPRPVCPMGEFCTPSPPRRVGFPWEYAPTGKIATLSPVRTTLTLRKWTLNSMAKSSILLRVARKQRHYVPSSLNLASGFRGAHWLFFTILVELHHIISQEKLIAQLNIHRTSKINNIV